MKELTRTTDLTELTLAVETAYPVNEVPKGSDPFFANARNAALLSLYALKYQILPYTTDTYAEIPEIMGSFIGAPVEALRDTMATPWVEGCGIRPLMIGDEKPVLRKDPMIYDVIMHNVYTYEKAKQPEAEKPFTYREWENVRMVPETTFAGLLAELSTL